MQEREQLFKNLLKENHERIYRVCAYHSGGRDDCDDLYQQVIINIWQSLKNFRGDSKISTWIYRIALNTCIDFNRAEGRRKKAYQEFSQNNPQMLSQQDVWDKIQKEKRLVELQIEINQLSVIDKLILSLYLEDQNSKDIAEVIGISEPNVRVKIHRIRESLRFKMEGKDNE